MKTAPFTTHWLFASALLGLTALPGGAQTTPAQTAPAPPTLAQVQALQLHDGFTLTYTVIEKDVRSPELKTTQRESLVRQYQSMVMQGSCTQAVADGMLKMLVAREKIPNLPKQYQVTLSAQGGKLLCVSRQSAGREYATDMKGGAHPLPLDTEIVLYDGHKTYDYSRQMQRMTIEKGWRGMRLAFLPGVGLPGFPLAKPFLPPDAPPPVAPEEGGGGLACKILEMQWSNPNVPVALYQQGRVYAGQSGNALRLTRATTTDGMGRPLQDWRYDLPQRFGGVWLARRVHLVESQPLADGRPSPERVRDFSVSRAAAQPLPAAQFDIRTYLPPGAGIYEGTAYHFRYDPRGGDLETQRRVQTARQAVNAQKQRSFSHIIQEAKSDHGDGSDGHGDGSDGNALLAGALSQAGAQGKNVFLIFHASWCGACIMLSHLLNEPQVKPLVGANYVVLEEDVFEHEKNGWENPGAQALFQKYGGRHAIPFYAVLTPDGKKLGDSIYGQETMGIPGSAAEEKAFLALLRKTAPRLTATNLATIKAAVERNTVLR